MLLKVGLRMKRIIREIFQITKYFFKYYVFGNKESRKLFSTLIRHKFVRFNEIYLKLTDAEKYEDIDFKGMYTLYDKIVIPFVDEDWYAPNFKFENGLYEIDNAQRNYMSYLHQNLSFSLSNENNKIDIIHGGVYNFEFDIDYYGDVTVTPYVISYRGGMKHNNYKCQLSLVENIITFDKEDSNIRIALSVTGTGKIKINKVMYQLLSVRQTKEYVHVDSSAKNQVSRNYNELNVAVITDKFTTECLGYEFNLIEFTPKNFLEVFNNNNIDMLFVESAWKGFEGSWEYKIGKYANQTKEELKSVLEYCQNNLIPTVFWNKEDPIHFDKFIDSAVLFDYIYTTDINMVEKYKKRCGHNNVFAMGFSSQPKLHNPIRIFDEVVDKFCFAGSYYSNRHADRKKDMDDLLEKALSYGLAIYDRNYQANLKGNTHFKFPDIFENCIQGSLDYREINVAYKGYKFMVNVNSVKESETMFSRRVYEGMACGTPILSSYSKGIAKQFAGIVTFYEDDKQFEKLVNNSSYYDEVSLRGIRKSLGSFTYKHRMTKVMKNAGINLKDNKYETVNVIVYIKCKEDVERAVEMHIYVFFFFGIITV